MQHVALRTARTSSIKYRRNRSTPKEVTQHRARMRTWQEAHDTECIVCNGTLQGVELVQCKVCTCAYHAMCMGVETEHCDECTGKEIHTIEQEQVRIQKVLGNNERRQQWEETHRKKCTVCDKDKTTVHCVSCTKSIHKRKCMQKADTNEQDQWQCKECASQHLPPHDTFRVAATLEHVTYFGKQLQWGMSELRKKIRDRLKEQDRHDTATLSSTDDSSEEEEQVEYTGTRRGDRNANWRNKARHDDKSGPIPMDDNKRDTIFTALQQSREVTVNGDGHCLYRAMGKVIGMKPGDLIKIVAVIAEEHCREDIQNVYTRNEAANKACGLRNWEDVEENQWRHTTVWSGLEEIKLMAMVLQRPIIVINAGTNTGQREEHLIITPRITQRDGGAHIIAGTKANTEIQKTYNKLEYCDPIYLLYQNNMHFNGIVQAQDEGASTEIPVWIQDMRARHEQQAHHESSVNVQRRNEENGNKRQRHDIEMESDDSDVASIHGNTETTEASRERNKRRRGERTVKRNTAQKTNETPPQSTLTWTQFAQQTEQQPMTRSDQEPAQQEQEQTENIAHTIEQERETENTCDQQQTQDFFDEFDRAAEETETNMELEVQHEIELEIQRDMEEQLERHARAELKQIHSTQRKQTNERKPDTTTCKTNLDRKRELEGAEGNMERNDQNSNRERENKTQKGKGNKKKKRKKKEN